MGKLPDVVVPIRQEFSEDVDCHHPQPTVRLNLQDGQDRLVQDRISNVLCRVCVGSDLPVSSMLGEE